MTFDLKLLCVKFAVIDPLYYQKFGAMDSHAQITFMTHTIAKLSTAELM